MIIQLQFVKHSFTYMQEVETVFQAEKPNMLCQ